MSDAPLAPRRPPALEDRDRVIDTLSRLFAAGRIELEDLETRMNLAVRADSMAALDAVLADFRGVGTSAVPATTTPLPSAPMRQDRPRGSRMSVAILSGTNRKGRWFPAPQHRVVALMGGAVLDFREADLETGTTDVSVWVLWGSVKIVVPPELDVEVHGFAVAGGLTQMEGHPAPLEQQQKRLRVHARVLMGAVEVQVLAPGESPREGRRRLRGRRHSSRRDRALLPDDDLDDAP